MYLDEIDDILEHYQDRFARLVSYVTRLAVCVVLLVAAMWGCFRLIAAVSKPLQHVEDILDAVSTSSTRVAISIADTVTKGWQSSQD